MANKNEIYHIEQKNGKPLIPLYEQAPKNTECRSVSLCWRDIDQAVDDLEHTARERTLADWEGELLSQLHRIQATDCGSVDVPPVMPADGSPLPVLTSEMLDRFTESEESEGSDD